MRAFQASLFSDEPAVPFLKWAGGKGQLLGAIDARLPAALRKGTVRRYVEPFMGGASVFFHVIQNHPAREHVLMDANEDLVLVYRVVRDYAEPLVERLEGLDREYKTHGDAARRDLYYTIRSRFNEMRAAVDYNVFHTEWVERAALAVFLNRTCFNGLFRMNAGGGFNTPFGKYKNPRICDGENLRRASALLKRADLYCADFSEASGLVERDDFAYFDPPYRPISASASFTAYSRHAFGDPEQERLARLFRMLDGRGAKLLLSNSDPRNTNPNDGFFDDLYAGYVVERVPASRSINSRADGRGPVNELLIRNYAV